MEERTASSEEASEYDDLTVDAPDDDSTVDAPRKRTRTASSQKHGPKDALDLVLASADGQGLYIIVPDGFYLPYRNVDHGPNRGCVRIYVPRLDVTTKLATSRVPLDVGDHDVRVEFETPNQRLASLYSIIVLGDSRLVASPSMHDFGRFFGAYQSQKHVRLRFSLRGREMQVQSAKTGARSSSVDVPVWSCYGRTRRHRKVEQTVTLGRVIPDAKTCNTCQKGECCLLDVCLSCYEAETARLVTSKRQEIETWAHDVIVREVERLRSES